MCYPSEWRMDMSKSVQSIIACLGLEPLPQEGGMFSPTHSDEHSGASYYLITAADDFSGLHTLKSTAVYHYYGGAPAQMLLLNTDGSVAEPVLGSDLAVGQRPQIVVPGGTWQATESLGEWTLLGTTLSPPFTWENFQLCEGRVAAEKWPSAAARIARLSRR
jgi:uncharacterized protein